MLVSIPNILGLDSNHTHIDKKTFVNCCPKYSRYFHNNVKLLALGNGDGDQTPSILHILPLSLKRNRLYLKSKP